jgi:hypothetical protein
MTKRADIAPRVPLILVVRTVVEQQMVGVFSASSIEEVVDMIDVAANPMDCEYAVLGSLALLWEGRTFPIPYKETGNEERMSHAWTVVGEMECEVERAVWTAISTSFVYFISDGKFVKIGVAKDPKGRMQTLQTGCAEKLVLLKAVPGDAVTERHYHSMFAALRMRGEWFHLEGALKTFLHGDAAAKSEPDAEEL